MVERRISASDLELPAAASIGKKVPLKRNSGVMPKRKSALKPWSFFWVAAKAMIGGGEREPGEHRDRDGQHAQRRARQPEQRSSPPGRRSTTRVSRNAIQASSPTTMSWTAIGVASIAVVVRRQMILPMIG